MQGLKLTVLYKNRTQCTEFVKYINNVLFDEHVRKKLLNVNFIAVFCDGSTDMAVIEKECIYIMFADPETLEPVLTFLSLKDLPSQDATGIMSAITSAFADISLPELREKMVFLASDGASVNSGVKTGLAVKFRESGQEWLLFVWCLSHRLELALKDALADVMEPIKKCLTNLFYLYEKSSKKLRELRNMHKVIAEVYVFENGRVKPSKCSGTRWIAHLLPSMSGLVDKFGLYLQHFENIIADPSNNTDKSTLEGKRKQLTDASILLRSALFIDRLDSAKIFSLLSQKEHFNLIVMVDRLGDMIFSYERMKRGFSKRPESVYNLTHVDKVLKDVVCEHDENGKKVYKYQDIKLDYFKREKNSLANNVESYVDLILDAIKERFGGISEDDRDLEGAPTAGDMFLHDICCIIDSRKWILPDSVLPSAENIELCFEKSLCCIERVFTQFEMILSKVNPSINIVSVQQEYS